MVCHAHSCPVTLHSGPFLTCAVLVTSLAYRHNSFCWRTVSISNSVPGSPAPRSVEAAFFAGFFPLFPCLFPGWHWRDGYKWYTLMTAHQYFEISGLAQWKMVQRNVWKVTCATVVQKRFPCLILVTEFSNPAVRGIQSLTSEERKQMTKNHLNPSWKKKNPSPPPNPVHRLADLR